MRRRRKLAPHQRPYGYYKQTYSRNELTPKIGGRKVRKYIMVHYADDSEGDEFIPVFEKARKKKRWLKLPG